MIRTIVIGVLACAGAIPAFAGTVHEEDFVVGVNPATGTLAVLFEEDEFPFPLPPSPEPALLGFALDDPGFRSAEPPDVAPGSFELLAPATQVRFEFISVSSPDLKLWDGLAPGLLPIDAANPWEISPVGGDFDTHPWFHIDTTDPAYSPANGPWLLTFRLADTRVAGGYAPSPAITVSFIPEPAALALLAVAALAARRRS